MTEATIVKLPWGWHISPPRLRTIIFANKLLRLQFPWIISAKPRASVLYIFGSNEHITDIQQRTLFALPLPHVNENGYVCTYEPAEGCFWTSKFKAGHWLSGGLRHAFIKYLQEGKPVTSLPLSTIEEINSVIY